MPKEEIVAKPNEQKRSCPRRAERDYESSFVNDSSSVVLRQVVITTGIDVGEELSEFVCLNKSICYGKLLSDVHQLRGITGWKGAEGEEQFRELFDEVAVAYRYESVDSRVVRANCEASSGSVFI
jgi:hypothetical protein